MIYEKCRDILLQEFELVQIAVAVQEKIRLAVTERQWTVFEDNLSAMNGIESKLENLEIEREIFTVSPLTLAPILALTSNPLIILPSSF